MRLFTILHSNDRLSPILKEKANTMFTGSYDPDPIHPKRVIPVPPFGENPAVDILLDEVELLNLELLDQRDAATNYKTVQDNLLLRNQELEARLESYHTRDVADAAEKYEHTQAQYRIVQLEKDLKTETGNRDHFRTLVAQQDAYLKELKVQIEQWKTEKNKETDAVRAELKTKTEETNHLARKAVELSQQLATLAEENNQFRQRNNSLLEENRKLYDKSQDLECEGCRTGEMGAYCGGCLGCLLRQSEYTVTQIDARLSAAQTDLEVYRATVGIQFAMISIMKPFLSRESARWFGRGGEAQQALEYIHSLQLDADAECAKLLKNVQARTMEVRGCTSEKCGDMIVTTTSSERKTPLPTNKDADYELPSQPKAQADRSLSEVVFNHPPLS